MEQTIPDRRENSETLLERFHLLKRVWWKILSLAFLMSIATLILTLFLPNIYRSTAVLAPAIEEDQNVSTLGMVAASVGFPIGVPSRMEDLEALFKSHDLTARVFRKHSLWEDIFPDRYDPKKGLLKVGFLDRIKGDEGEWKKPTEWDAIRVAEKNLVIALNSKLGVLSISFDTVSPDSAERIATLYIDEAKSVLQEEALERANKNKRFILEQISKTADALSLDRMYSLYGQEVEREMLARNREQFGFRLIDRPRVPDRKAKPHRILASVLVFFVVNFVCVFWYLFLAQPSHRQYPDSPRLPSPNN